MKSTVCWRNTLFLFGMIVFLMLLISACTPGNGPTAHRVAPTITSADSTVFTVGTAGTFTVTATGNPTPTFALTGTLPSGVTFNDMTGVLSGTPAAGSSGIYPVTITASNGVSPDATQNFTLTVYSTVAMIISSAGPWDQISEYQDGMNQVFGAGNWDQLDIYSETGAAFAPDSPYKFIYLDGSDGDSSQLVTYLAAHITDIENWVSNGGRLYINAATWNSIDVNAPFGVLIQYGYYTDTANAVNSAHPIFNGPFLPAGTTYTGDHFGHNRVVGTGLTNIIVSADDATLFCLSSAVQCTGFILYGGITSDYYHSPSPNAHNLYMNILHYASGQED